MTTRRRFLMGASIVAGHELFGGSAFGEPARGTAEPLAVAIAQAERESGGRLGVAVLDTRDGTRFGHHADDRFPMCSTFKLLASAAVLRRVDQQMDQLERRVAVTAKDVVPDSTRIKGPVPAGMTLAELCEAAMTYSDNTAGNLILASIGGPQALTAYARSLGDAVTRLDRIEPDLNEALPGDLRDTTTPAAMLKNLQTLVLGDALSSSSKAQLTAWLTGNKTGDTRLRAGLPPDWRAGDKTGTGERGTANDIAIAWPPQRPPILIAAYLTETAVPPATRNAAHAQVARAVAVSLTP